MIPTDSNDLHAFPAIPGDVGHPRSPGRFTFSRTTRWSVKLRRTPTLPTCNWAWHCKTCYRMHDISVTMIHIYIYIYIDIDRYRKISLSLSHLHEGRERFLYEYKTADKDDDGDDDDDDDDDDDG